jgi:hypothetical protein
MITNFEDLTYKITADEIAQIPAIIAILQDRIGKEKAITSNAMMNQINYRNDAARFRVLINHIRRTGLITDLCASSKGYYIARTQQEFERYVQSLTDRINATQQVLDAIYNNHSQQYSFC